MSDLNICSTCKHYNGNLDDLTKVFSEEMLGGYYVHFIFCKADRKINARLPAESLKECDKWEVCNDGYKDRKA